MWRKWQICQNGDNLKANANEKAKGDPWKASEFGKSVECGKNGKFVKIAYN